MFAIISVECRQAMIFVVDVVASIQSTTTITASRRSLLCLLITVLKTYLPATGRFSASLNLETADN